LYSAEPVSIVAAGAGGGTTQNYVMARPSVSLSAGALDELEAEKSIAGRQLGY
jgi:hypothetical protein